MIFCDFLENSHFCHNLIPKIDSVAHLLSKNVYANICHGKDSKFTAVDKFQKFRVDTLLKWTRHHFQKQGKRQTKNCDKNKVPIKLLKIRKKVFGKFHSWRALTVSLIFKNFSLIMCGVFNRKEI